ncbi:MAG: HNH endonuclease family protein, partial [Alphaproteobacteria bacterium]
GWDIPADVAKGVYKRVGNLTLLDANANTRIGNGVFGVKKPIYIDSPFLLTRELSKYGSWGVAEIDERQAELAKCAPLVWPLKWS